MHSVRYLSGGRQPWAASRFVVLGARFGTAQRGLMARTRWIGVGLMIGLVQSVIVPPLTAQVRCPGGVISEIVFEIQKPLGSDGTSSRTLGWVFNTLNFVHVRTHEQVVRWELHFDQGDCLDPALIEESERSLRSLRYVSEAEIDPESLGAGRHRVHVRLRDAWPLSGGVGLSFDQGVALTGISVNHRNVLGTGTRLGLFRNVYRERRRVGLIVRQPNLFGSRIDGTLQRGRTRSGEFFSESLVRPFSGEFGVGAFRQVARKRDDYFSYSVDPSTGYSQALLRFEEERYEVSVQRRWGDERSARLVTGLGLSREEIRFPFDEAGFVLIVDDAFDEPLAATGPFPTEIRRQVRDHAASRVTFTLGLRGLTFGSVMGLDALEAPQDVFTGGALTLTAAPTISSGDEPADVYLRAQGAWGARSAHTYLRLWGDLQTRHVGSEPSGTPSGGPAGWRDLIYELHGSGYWLPSAGTRLFTRVSYTAGYSLDRPFQLTLGGREAIRGYNDDAYPAARRFLATVEQRFPLRAVSTGWADVGVAFFADVGRGWAGAVPFGRDSGWRAGAGAGLRFGLPAGASNVVRLDVGLPMTGEREEQGVLFRVYTELFGLLDRRSWPTQVERSRWYGTDPDLTRRPYNPLAGN